MAAPLRNPSHPWGVVTTTLPGPNRQRRPTRYEYRVRYRNPDLHRPSCLMIWDVLGGRDNYQIAAERTIDNRIAWHCTCPDAIFRGSRHPTHFCKHVHGLFTLLNIDSGPSAAAPHTTASPQHPQAGKVPSPPADAPPAIA